MSLGKLIGRGNTAEVFELSDKEVLKLFYEKMPFEYIEKEHKTSKVINHLGIPSPNVGEFMEIDNTLGIIYEKITGKSFTQVLSSQPLLLKKNAHIFAELQVSFHEKRTDKLPLQKEYLSRNISGTNLLSKEEKELILSHLSQLPEDNKVCHGDYHSDNIMLMDGKAKILDWMTGTSGNPCADVARTLIIMRYSYLPSDMPRVTKLLIQIVRKLFTRYYLNSYINLTNISRESIDKWLLPVMAARLIEGIPEPEKQFLLRAIKQNL